jgi:hypothetical protein
MLLSDYLQLSWSNIDSESKWVKGAYCLFSDPLPRYCSAGTLDENYHKLAESCRSNQCAEDPSKVYDNAVLLLMKNKPARDIDSDCLEEVNDSSSYSEISKMWLDAIREAKASEAVEIEIEEAKANTEIFYPVAA